MAELIQEAVKSFNIKLIRNIDTLNLPIGRSGEFKDEIVTVLGYQITPENLDSLQRLKNEFNILAELRHKNIQKLLKCDIIRENWFVCVEFMDLGSLKRVISTSYPKGIPEIAISTIVRQLAEALVYIHENKVIHRSIKCSHILLDTSGLARLGGFHHAVQVPKCNRWIGVEARIHAFDESLEDSFSWLAPELIRQDINGYSYNSDVYSLGIAVCEMGNGFPPFEEMEPLQILYEKLRGSTPFLQDVQTCPSESDAQTNSNSIHVFSHGLHDFVQKCLTSHPENRPNSKQLLEEHSFLRSDNTMKPFKELLPAAKPL